eukprot:Blabericola_migrator_1__12555@NODE_798_length_6465_cov_65_648171_g566_i0_p1_GENE_NODE_798_length_6465_cov_65_648171_g566_i0NODE_798_length_6465_cov_65_648171_g566_i0_p1_ORF_typecomplete_len1588_score463_57_NODE_798_length_6465_cov_65_648171_g566_i015236286
MEGLTIESTLQGSIDTVVTNFREALKVVLGHEYFQDRGTQTLTKEQATSFLAVLGATPVGAELGVEVLSGPLGQSLYTEFASGDQAVQEQLTIVSLGLICESLETFPLKDLNPKRSAEEKWYYENAGRWESVAGKARDLALSLVSKLLHPETATDIPSSICVSCLPATNKVCQLVAELWLYYTPSAWPELTQLIMDAGRGTSSLVPSQVLFGSLREIAWQLSAAPEGVSHGFSKHATHSARKSSWEMGRISANKRNEIAADCGKLLELCWSVAIDDLRAIATNKALVDEYLGSFAEVIQLQIPLTLSTSTYDHLRFAKWEFFSSDLVAVSDRIRDVCESFCDVTRSLVAKKNKRTVKDEVLTPDQQQSFFQAFLLLLTQCQKRFHPLIGVSDRDDIDVMIEGTSVTYALLEQLAVYLDRSTTDQIKPHQLTLLANLTLALCNPSLAVATATAQCIRVLQRLGLCEGPTAVCMYKLLWLRSMRVGDPNLKGLIPQVGAQWLGSDVPRQIIDEVMSSLSLARTPTHVCWSDLVIEFLGLDEDTGVLQPPQTETSLFSASLANLRNIIKGIVQKGDTPIDTQAEVCVTQSMKEFCHVLITNEVFNKAPFESSVPVSGAPLKSVHAKLRGFLCPAYTVLDCIGFLIECCGVSNACRKFGQDLLYLVLRLPVSFVDTCATLSTHPQRVIIDTASLDPHTLPSHWAMLEYRRLDMVVSTQLDVCDMSVLTHFLVKRVLLEAPSDWPQAEVGSKSGTLEEEEDHFYLIRRKAVKGLACVFSKAVSTTQSTHTHTHLVEQMKPFISLMAHRSTSDNVPESEKTFLAENALTLAGITKSSEVQQVTFYALGPSLLKTCLDIFNATGTTPKELALFLFGTDTESQGEVMTRRRALLRELHSVESVLKRLILPSNEEELRQGGFLQDLSPDLCQTRVSLRNQMLHTVSIEVGSSALQDFPCVIKTPLEPVVTQVSHRLLSLCHTFLCLWKWALDTQEATQKQRENLWQYTEDEVTQLAKQQNLSRTQVMHSLSLSDDVNDIMFNRHLQQIRLALFRLVGLCIKVLTSTSLYGEQGLTSVDHDPSHTLHTLTHFIKSTLSDPGILNACPLAVKDLFMKHVIINGVLHGYSSYGLPSTPLETPAPLDPMCFFFPCVEAVCFHTGLFHSFVKDALTTITQDVAAEWVKAEASRKALMEEVCESKRDAMCGHHTVRITQASAYSRSVTSLLVMLFTTSSSMPLSSPGAVEDEPLSEGMMETDTGVCEGNRSVLYLRLQLHTCLKQGLFQPSELTDVLLAAAASTLKVPHPEVISQGHQALRAFVKSTWKRIVSSLIGTKVQLVDARRFFDEFSLRCSLVFKFVLSRAFSVAECDPSFTDPIDWNVVPTEAQKTGHIPFIIKYHIMGGVSASPLRPFLALPFAVNKTSHTRAVAINATLNPSSFWSHTIGTLYEIARAMAACFMVRCNVLVLKRSAFAGETTTEEMLMQLSLDPYLQEVVSTLGDSNHYPWVLPDETFKAWVANIASPRTTHDSKQAKDCLRHFVLENVNALLGGQSGQFDLVLTHRKEEKAAQLTASLSKKLSDVDVGDLAMLFGPSSPPRL